MRRFLLCLFSVYSAEAVSSSCCVSNTSVSNLIILPARWQQTFSLAQNRTIGETNEKGQSTFRDRTNKDVITSSKLDLSYAWTSRYQSNISFKYQGRSREINGSSASNSGWNDVNLSHAYKLFNGERVFLFQTLNLPTATSTYNSREALAVDARGTGTYQSSIGIFGIKNYTNWDFVYSPEVHHSFARTFHTDGSTTEVGSFWGASLTVGTGYIPWRSKGRYGVSITPRYEGAKEMRINDNISEGEMSLVWDTSLNYTYTINAEYALGINYIDQTILGPVKNSLLNRSLGFQFQARWL